MFLYKLQLCTLLTFITGSFILNRYQVWYDINEGLIMFYNYSKYMKIIVEQY